MPRHQPITKPAVSRRAFLGACAAAAACTPAALLAPPPEAQTRNWPPQDVSDFHAGSWTTNHWHVQVSWADKEEIDARYLP